MPKPDEISSCADPLKKRPFWEDRAPRRALAIGLVVLVGLDGYVWHWANRRPIPVTEARFRLTAAPGASSPAASAAGSVTLESDTASPTAIGDPQLVPRSEEAEEDYVTVEQPAPSPIQTNPPMPIDSAAPAPSAALAKADLTLPPPAQSPVPLLRAGERWRHVDRPRPPARPSFWQWLFGHKDTKKAKPDKPRY